MEGGTRKNQWVNKIAKVGRWVILYPQTVTCLDGPGAPGRPLGTGAPAPASGKGAPTGLRGRRTGDRPPRGARPPHQASQRGSSRLVPGTGTILHQAPRAPPRPPRQTPTATATETTSAAAGHDALRRPAQVSRPHTANRRPGAEHTHHRAAALRPLPRIGRPFRCSAAQAPLHFLLLAWRYDSGWPLSLKRTNLAPVPSLQILTEAKNNTIYVDRNQQFMIWIIEMCAPLRYTESCYSFK